MPVTRREGREWAVQMLFQLELNPNMEKTAEEIFKEFWDGQIRVNGENPDVRLTPQIRKFSEGIVRGVMRNLSSIDEILVPKLDNWQMDRIGNVERSVLRMGIYELLFAEDKPPVPVVINEAVDVCKFFVNSESARFINGILDSIAKDKAK
ncbi:MAG: transcription antitermination factor NusB [Kiritimatiellae bacterium]|nr:transcription antitermination factor NusB [Kiritimatiellia bacterium]